MLDMTEPPDLVFTEERYSTYLTHEWNVSPSPCITKRMKGLRYVTIGCWGLDWTCTKSNGCGLEQHEPTTKNNKQQ